MHINIFPFTFTGFSLAPLTRILLIINCLQQKAPQKRLYKQTLFENNDLTAFLADVDIVEAALDELLLAI